LHSLRYLVAVIGTLLTVSALAQAPAGPPTRVRGTVAALDGETLTVKSRSGEELSIAFPPGTMVVAMTKRTLADVKSGDFVGVTSVRGGDGKMRALEVHIFPEAMRGTGEGEYAWDLVPNSTMTNGAITGISSATSDNTITVNHKGEMSEIMVPATTPVVAYLPGDVNLLKPGATVLVLVQKKADGGLVAMRVNAEKDGVKPPM
jgi:hypothetical protein